METSNPRSIARRTPNKALAESTDQESQIIELDIKKDALVKTQSSLKNLRKKKTRKKKPHLKTNDQSTENHEVELADRDQTDENEVPDKSNQERVRETPFRHFVIRIPSSSPGIFGR